MRVFDGAVIGAFVGILVCVSATLEAMLVCLLFDGNATGNSDFSDLTMASVVASFCLGPIDGAIVGALLTRRAFRRPHDD